MPGIKIIARTIKYVHLHMVAGAHSKFSLVSFEAKALSL